MMTKINEKSALKIVGKSYNRIDGIEKATGQAIYIDDMFIPNMLYGKVLRSTIPHGKIKSINTSKAENLAGVKTVLTSNDLPDTRFGAYIFDTPALARGKVRFVGEPVAAVAAVDEDTALTALNLIKVEYEELPTVLDTDHASSPDAPLIHEELNSYPAVFNAVRSGNVCSRTTFKEGDLEEAFKNSDHVFEHSFTTPIQQQVPIETCGALAKYDISGNLTVWTTTQAPHLTQIRIFESLQIPINKIRVIGTRVGGGFGAKIEPKAQLIAVALAKKAGQPVKLIFDRKEELTVTSPRHAAKITVKSGVNNDGKLTARHIRLVFDTGAYADDGPGVAGFGGLMSLGPYKIPAYEIDSCAVYTNKIPCGAFRGFGNPQAMFAVESQMDIIAEKLGIDPLDFRIKNALENGDVSTGGLVRPSVGLKECLRKAAEKAGWGKTLSIGQGMGVACMQHISGVLSSSALVRINHDGTATVFTGAVDIGQGSDTVLTQIAAEELGLSMENVSIVTADSGSTPYNWAVSASRVTRTNGNAIRQAAAEAKKQIFELAAKFLEASPEELEIQDNVVKAKNDPDRKLSMPEIGGISHWASQGPIMGKARVMVEGHTYDPEKVIGFPFGTMAGFIFGTQIVEVEVDSDTGRVQVLNAVAAHDVGQAVNPVLIEGQIEGGFIQGLGYALFEELAYQNGKVVNDSLLDYKIPTAKDIPKMIPIIVEERDPDGPFGAKGVGEPVLVSTAPAIANAIRQAVGVRITDLPLSMERVWKKLNSSD